MSKHTRKQALRRRRIFIICCTVVLLLAIALVSIGISSLIKSFNGNDNGNGGGNNNKQSKTASYSAENKNGKGDEEIKKISSATVINTGDIMVHSTQLDGAKTANGYDFSAFFKNIKPYVSKADLAVANLEVTFGGEESGSYKGYPAFNTPDCLADVIKDAGFDLMLTTNNHAYDTGLFGLKRTVDVLKEKGLLYVGTRKSASEKNYTVQKVNGIKLGMTAFSYENKCDTAGRKSLNGNIIAVEANDLINTFDYDSINDFYSLAEKTIENMKKDGAEAIIFYMHWGEEYQLKENVWQDTIAQELCNRGVDVIVGSHPHVIEPIALLHSENGEHKTVCIYSMGNAISNQRQEIMHPECTTGHTEDGMLFYYTFDKYSDGSVTLSSVDIVPTWVDKYKGGSGYLYSIVPLSTADEGSNYGLSANSLQRSQKSYERTKAIVSAGLTEIQTDLGCKVRFSQ